jgi:putative ABC transport system permease protein
MQLLKLVVRNALRRKIRTGLTVLGLAVATLAFGLLSTVVGAWYAAADHAPPTRLITRNAISLSFPLPLAYRDRIRALDGVVRVSHASWFGGVYQDPKNFFAQFAIEAHSYLPMYPQFRFQEEELRAFYRDRRGAIIGRKLANTYGLKVGDYLPMHGTAYPGDWEFTVRAIYDGAEGHTDTSQMLFHWEYLNETMKTRTRGRSDLVGVFIVDIEHAGRAAEVTAAIDGLFANSLAETLTQTEKTFHLGFVAMTEAIVVAIRLVSFIVLVIIFAVMANTMAMTGRERLAEYATLKALGFGPGFVTVLIGGESLLIAAIGAVVGIAATFPVTDVFAVQMGTLFPRVEVSMATVDMQAVCAVAVGLGAAVFPVLRATRVRIAEGLRSVA